MDDPRNIKFPPEPTEQELTTDLWPPWKQAVEDAVKQFTYGDVISKTWLYDKFGIEEPCDTTPKIKLDKINWQFLSASVNFRKTMLEDHQMYLSPERGEGYLIVNPSQQAKLAYTRYTHEIANSMQWMAKSVMNVNMALLTQQERQEADKYRIKIVMLRDSISAVRRKRMLPEIEAE